MTDVDALRAELLALWNRTDAHEAAWVEIGLWHGTDFRLNVLLTDGEMKYIDLGTCPSTWEDQWQLALDTLRRAADDMKARRNSAREEHHGSTS